jgi:hypothetical protein
MCAHLPTGTSLAPTPVSSGFLTGLGLETLRQQVQGTWSPVRLLAYLPPVCAALSGSALASGSIRKPRCELGSEAKRSQGPPTRRRLHDGLDAWENTCGTYLLQDIEAMIGRGGRSQEIGEALQTYGRQRFSWWHRVRGGPLQRSRFRSVRNPLRREVEQWLEAGGTCGTSKTEGVCRASLKLRRALWTCVPLEGVESPNNTAEQAMGPRVLWRKCSCGTQSVQGSRLVETLMTVVAPLKQ